MRSVVSTPRGPGQICVRKCAAITGQACARNRYGYFGMGARCLVSLAFFVLSSCGGADTPAPQAGSTGSGAGSTTTVSASPVTPKGKAEEKYQALSKRLGELPTDIAVDPSWLKAELQAVLALNPNHSAAQFNQAVLMERAGDVAGARKVYESIHDSDPGFTPAIENLAALMAESGDGAEASGLYKQVIKKDPATVTARLGLAQLDLNARRYKDAIALCRKALRRKADSVEAFRIMARAYKELKNEPMAKLVIGRGLRVFKHDADLHYILAEILLARGDVVEGVAALKKVIGLKPGWLQVRADLAGIALKYRDFGTAAQQYEAILKKEPTNRAAEVSLAVAYKGLGRFKQAEGLYKKILAKAPKDLDALWNVAVLYHRHLNRYDEATARYKAYADAAPSGDKRKGRVANLLAKVQRIKNDRAAIEARLAKEKKRAAAIDVACAAVREGKSAAHIRKIAKKIGSDEERIEVSWQLAVQGQQAIQAGELAPGEDNISCAFALLPNTPQAKTSACAPMKVMWTQILYQLGRLDDAGKAIDEALACDANNPDATLIKQQLQELKAQKAAATP